jgi:signal transduction histidine kinase
MIFLALIASLLIAAITIYQYNEQADDYHSRRLERKEEAIKSAIYYELNRNKEFPIETSYLPKILKEKLNEISDIHNLDINIYDLEGNLLRASARYNQDSELNNLPEDMLQEIRLNDQNRVVVPNKSSNGNKYKSSYSYLNDYNGKPIAIIGVPYLQDNSFQDEELKEFLLRLSLVYIVILIIAVVIAYFLSKFITRPIEYLSSKMEQTGLDRPNEKIILRDASLEISHLVNSYNDMVDQLQNSAVKLAQIERKQAWREMARQVAHEIKNPLTPMRLSIQSFEYSFDPNDPDIKQKVKDLSRSIIQQIDTMDSIASAFSSFAQMPAQNKENLNVVEVVENTMHIFTEDYVSFGSDKKIINAKVDKVQVNRIITNLVANAIHAVLDVENPRVEVMIKDKGDSFLIVVEDNGKGISDEEADQIFEPKFTTKTSGMGLGLPMVKNIIEANRGMITFKSEYGKGTVFTVTLPK